MIKIPGTNYLIGIQGTSGNSDFLPDGSVQLNQIHSGIVLMNPSYGDSADGMIFKKGESFPVLKVADCLPVFAIWDNYIGAAHAGWRGLADGIIENLLSMLDQQPRYLILGPCICGNCYEVGREVLEKFAFYSKQITLSEKQRGSLDLRKIALAKAHRIAGKDFKIIDIKDCTFESDGLYSYRQNKTTHRNYIWLAETEVALHIRQLETEAKCSFRKKEKN